MEDEQGQEQGWAKLRAPWDPNVSGRRVIQRLLRAEEQVPGGPGAAVCCQRGCDEAVFPLSVSLLDRFLAASLSPPVSPHCLAAGCILIASKLTEGDGVTAEALCAAAGCSFLPSSLRMERLILATLRWDTAAVTPQDFLPHFLASLEERGGAAGGGGSEGAPPSLVAAASLDCALRGLGAEAPGQLAELCQVSSRVSFDLEGSPFTLCTSVRSRRSTVMSTPTVGDREHDISWVFVRFEVPWQDLRVLVDGTR
uniref:Cyclin-like domain-containing protein n=1 Tax=Mola mola TaxID=94237 RepID=A0A3Q4BCD9_MOLML